MTKRPPFNGSDGPPSSNTAPRGNVPTPGRRYFTDDGKEIAPHLVPVPDLCFGCTKYESGEQMEEMLCNLARADKEIDEVFLCFAYQPSSPAVDREAVLRDLCRKAGVEYSDESAETNGEDDEPVRF